VVKRGGEGEVAAVAARTTGAPGGRQLLRERDLISIRLPAESPFHTIDHSPCILINTGDRVFVNLCYTSRNAQNGTCLDPVF
jgi:hypothetical protein